VSDRFDELVGGIDDPEERARLRRVHELLLSVDAPPELSPELGAAAVPKPEPLLPRRRGRALALLAAALAAASFGAGWLAGARDGDVEPEQVIVMNGSAGMRGATGSIELLPQDASGNWPMLVLVRGLEPSRDRTDFYELWLTKDGKPAESCGRFTVHPGLTTVTLSVPYGLRRYDGWIVTRAGSDEILLTTA
jgi:hypothetical protein